MVMSWWSIGFRLSLNAVFLFVHLVPKSLFVFRAAVWFVPCVTSSWWFSHSSSRSWTIVARTSDPRPKWWLALMSIQCCNPFRIFLIKSSYLVVRWASENIEARRWLRVTRRTHVSVVPHFKTLLLSRQDTVSLLESLTQRLRLHHMLSTTD